MLLALFYQVASRLLSLLVLRGRREVSKRTLSSWCCVTKCWSCVANFCDHPIIADIAEAHGKTPAQVMLHWGVQEGRSVIPKSTKPHRIAENIDVLDFTLTPEEIAAVDSLDTGRRGGPGPDDITLEAFGRAIPEA